MNFSNPIKNTNAATLVSGTSSSNYIINSVAERNGKVTIDAGAGDDYIADNSRVSSVNAGAGNDTVDHMGQLSTILGGAGNDSIRNSGQTSWIEGGAGRDTIVNTGHQTTVDGGDGNDYIDNTDGRSAGDSSVLLGGKGNDTISNGDVGGYGVSIDSGEGNDIIKHNSISSTINAGVGNNLISLGGAAYDNVIIYGGGNDTIVGFNASNIIDLNNATITNRETIGSDFKLTTNSGSILLKNASNITPEFDNIGGDTSTASTNSVINNTTAGLVITGTPNADTITNSGENVTIDALAGDDYIVNSSNSVSINSDDGNDTINAYPTSSLGSLKDVSIIAGAGNDKVSTGTMDYGYIDFGDGNDTLYMSGGKSPTILGGAGKDSIRNDGGFTTYIDGGTDDDYIETGSREGTVYGGAGNDTIWIGGRAPYTSALGGEGNDSIIVGSNGNTINGGTGNNSITLNAGVSDNVIYFAPILGNSDIIYGYNSNTTINLIDGIVGSTSLSGSDLVISIKPEDSSLHNYGTITIKDFASVGFVNIVDSEGNFSTIGAAANIDNTTGRTLITGTEYDDYILNHGYQSGYVTINALSGNDTIENWGGSASINAGADNDSIFSAGSYSTIEAGSGDDFVSLKGAYNSEDDYKDSATNTYGTGNRVYVTGGEGKDSIYNYGSTSSTIDAGDGDDFINNNAPRVSVIGGAGADTINNYKPYSTIYGGIGNDSIFNTNTSGYGTTGTKAIIYGEDGDDYIRNTADSVSVYGGEGNDTIINNYRSTYAPTGNYSYLDGGNGNDYITNTEQYVTIKGGAGNDTIINSGTNSTYIYGEGDGNDLIDSWRTGDKISLTSGEITNVSLIGSTVIIAVGNSSLTINKAKDQDITIIDKDGKDISTIISGTYTTSSTIPTGLSYNDDHTVLTVTDQYTGALEPANYDSVVDTINAGGRTKAIAITGNANDNSIVGGSKADTLTGGAGDDTLDGRAGNDKLDGGAGDDMLLSSAGNDTLTGGAGNDTFQYATGDGNDVIADFGTGSDIFKLTKGEITKITTSKKNSDVVVTIGKGTVTFKDALTKSITIENADGSLKSIVGGVNVIYNESENVKLVGLGSADSIYNALGAASVTASTGTGNDTIVNYGFYANIDAGAGNDYIFNEAEQTTIKGGAGNDTVRMTVWNDGSIVDGEAGNDVVILGKYADGTNATTQYVSVYGGAGNDSIISYVSYHSTINGGAGNDTIDLSDRANNATTSYKTETLVVRYENGGGKDVITNYAEGLATIAIDSLSDFKKAATGGKKAPNDIVFTIGKGSITIKDGVGKAVSFVDKAGNSITQAYGASTVTVSDSSGDTVDVSKDNVALVVDGTERTKPVTIVGNTKANTIISGKGNDTLTGGKGNDVFVYTGGNDVITDYTTGKNVIRFSSDTYLLDASVSGSDMVFYTNTGNLTLLNTVKTNSRGDVTGNKITVIDAEGVNTGAQLYDMATILPANGDGDTIKANIEVTTINAAKRSKTAYFIGNGNNNTITGGSKNDTIVSMSGNNIITGGKGKDLFVFDATNGSDTITDYTAKQDSITIAAGVYADYTVDGKNVIMTFTDASSNTLVNTLTIVNVKDKIITVNGKDDTYSDKTELVLTKNDTGTFNMNDSKYSLIKTVDGSKTTKGVELIANSNGNTLMGGKGKDILTGGLGADTFVYTTSGGNDTIKSYVAGEDVIQLGKKTTISKAAVVEVKDTEGNVIQANYVFTIGKGKLTVENGATKPITFVDNDGNSIRYDANYTPTFAAAFEERFYDEDLDSILTDSKEIAVDYTSTIADSLSQPTIPLTTNKPDKK